MGQGRGQIVLPGQNGAPGLPPVEQMVMALAEQAEWPTIGEWLVLESARMNVVKLADGTRILQVWTQGSRRGFRIPMPPLTAAVVARDLGSGLALVPESDEVAAAAQPPEESGATPDEPPAPPTMGQ